MRQIARTLARSGAGLFIVGLTMAGCAPVATQGGPPPPDTDTDTTTASGARPLLSSGCEELIDLTTVQHALGSVEPGIDPVRVPGGSWPLSHIALGQNGALDCYWGDDAAPQRENPSYLAVTVLPNAAESWSAGEAQLGTWSKPFAGHGDAAFSKCDGSSSYLYCQYDVLVGETWVRAEVMNLDSLEDAAPIIRSITDAVATADVAEATWSTTSALPSSCADWLTAAEISAAVGVDGLAEREFPLLMPIILNDAFADGLACSWSNSYSSAQAMPIQVVALPGAEWAWDTAWAKPRPERSPSAPLDGVGDQAFAGCAIDENVCFVDVLADGAWIAVDGNSQAGVVGLKQIAAAAIAGLR